MPSQLPAKSRHSRGKARLIHAALSLASKSGSFNRLSVREIGREAGLNPNTFYRHFASLEELGLVIIDLVLEGRRQPLRDIRRKAAEAAAAQLSPPVTPAEYWEFCLRKAKLVARATIKSYFEFVTANPEPFLIGVREMRSLSPKLRQTVQDANDAIAGDLADDIRIFQLLPMLSDDALREMALIIVRQLFVLSADYIGMPEKRDEMQKAAHDLIIHLIAGAIALEVSHKETMLTLTEIMRSTD
jgi:TetR/AcrR family transcriptional regulator, fatty acid biosynthesis regulator